MVLKLKLVIFKHLKICTFLRFKHIIIFLLIIHISCKKEHSKKEILEFKPEQIVVISKNAPENYTHYVKQDSLGKIIKDTLQPNRK